MDETTFHVWQSPSRCWLRKGMQLNLPTTRGRSITVIGALSESRGLVHTEVFMESNNTATFSAFIQRLKQKCSERPTVVIMDNLSVHKARPVLARFDERFIAKFLPTYSSALNPIERVWNVAKHEWRKTQHMFALYEYEDEEHRERGSMARVNKIIGKFFFNVSNHCRLALAAGAEEDCAAPHSPHGAVLERAPHLKSSMPCIICCTCG